MFCQNEFLYEWNEILIINDACYVWYDRTPTEHGTSQWETCVVISKNKINSNAW